MPPADALDRRTWWLLALALAGVLALYARTIDHGFTAWDDPGYVSGNTALGPLSVEQVKVEFGRQVMGNYHPLTMLSYALDILLAGGKEPAVLHCSSVAIHLVNVLLLFLVGRALFGSPIRAALVAVLFAWHPMRVESVAWISGRKDLVMFTFACLTLLAYARYLRRRSWPLLIAALVAFAAACLCKATAVALVPVLVLIDLLVARDLRAFRPWLEKLPFVAVALVIGVVTVRAQQEGILYGSALRIPLLDRVVLACANLPIYFAQLTVPFGLSSFYPYAEGGRYVPSYAWPVAMGLIPLAWLVWRSRHRKWVFFGAVFFVLTIALVLQLFTVGQAMRADRYTYLPSVGWALVMVEFASWATMRSMGRERIVGPVLGYAGILFLVAWGRVPVWKDAMSVWNDMVATAPGSPLALANRSGTAYQEGRYEAALRDAGSALRIDPGSRLAHYNHGLALMKLERFEEGVKELNPFLGTPGADTELYEVMVYGLMRTGRFEEAIAPADTVLRRVPGDPQTLVRRSYCLARLGRLQEARAGLEQAKSNGGEQAEAWYTSAYVHLLEGDTAAACGDVRRSMDWPMKDAAAEKVRRQFLDRFCAVSK